MCRFSLEEKFCTRTLCAHCLLFSKVPKICLRGPPRGPGDSLLVWFREIFFKLSCGRNDSWWLKPASGFQLYKPSSLYDDKVYVLIILLDGDHAFKWQSNLRNFYFASRGPLFTLLCKNMIRLKCNDDIDLFFTSFNHQLSLRPQLILKKYFSELYQKWVPFVNHRRGPPVPQPPTPCGPASRKNLELFKKVKSVRVVCARKFSLTVIACL